jgi:hypothetical protein
MAECPAPHFAKERAGVPSPNEGLTSPACWLTTPALKVLVVHPLSNRATRLAKTSLLRPGNPAAPKSDCLPLLPPGPGGVHRLLPRRTQPSTPLGLAVPTVPQALEGEFDPATAVCGYRAPPVPRLARPNKCYHRTGEWSNGRRTGARCSRARGDHSGPPNKTLMRAAIISMATSLKPPSGIMTSA